MHKMGEAEVCISLRGRRVTHATETQMKWNEPCHWMSVFRIHGNTTLLIPWSSSILTWTKSIIDQPRSSKKVTMQRFKINIKVAILWYVLCVSLVQLKHFNANQCGMSLTVASVHCYFLQALTAVFTLTFATTNGFPSAT